MKIAILGYGLQGQSVYEYYKNQDNQITICDKDNIQDLPDGVESQIGDTYLNRLNRFDLIFRSPGIHPYDIVKANDPEILSKVTTSTNEFFKLCPSKNIIGVTGTKGKGTTSTLIAKMLEACGLNVHIGGNIGIPPLDLLRNNIDARAVRTRANEAMEMAADYIEQKLSQSNGQELVSASLACGAAGPVYNLVNGLSNKGYGFSKIILTDSDPMALATAVGLAENTNLEQKIDIQLRNLITEPLTSFIKEKSVDLVDLLGLFEYLPKELSIELLNKVREIVKPGGLIIFGNMLDERPQQQFFSNVVQWPSLQQRSIKEVLGIVHKAGFSLNETSVRVPTEGVYAVYSIVASGDDYESDSATRKISIAEKLGLTSIEAY